jgi:predicted phage tail protein
MKKRMSLALLAILALASLAWAASVTLQWDPNGAADQVLRYTVYQSTDNVTFAKVADTTGISYTVENLSPAKYYFRVTATNAWGESGPSNTVSTPPGLPQAPNNIKLIIAAIVGGIVMLGVILSRLFGRK